MLLLTYLSFTVYKEEEEKEKEEENMKDLPQRSDKINIKLQGFEKNKSKIRKHIGRK